MTNPIPLCQGCVNVVKDRVPLIPPLVAMHECGNPEECQCPGRHYRLVPTSTRVHPSRIEGDPPPPADPPPPVEELRPPRRWFGKALAVLEEEERKERGT